MRFGVFYELQVPKPWDEGSEHRLIQDSIEQVQLADRIGIDYAWSVEHHFLDEYSHCSSTTSWTSTPTARPPRFFSLPSPRRPSGFASGSASAR